MKTSEFYITCTCITKIIIKQWVMGANNVKKHVEFLRSHRSE